MKISAKRVIAFLLSSVLLLQVAACGKAGKENQNEEN